MPGPFYWAGVTDQYFAAVFMPAAPQSSTMVTMHSTMEMLKDPSNPKSEKEIVHLLGLGVGNPNGATQAELFVGPKDLDVLNSTRARSLNGAGSEGPSLEGVIDFGNFGWFAKMLFRALNWIHDRLISNWGTAFATRKNSSRSNRRSWPSIAAMA